MHKLKGIQLSVDELKTLNDAHIIISEMQDATNSESLARLKDDLGNLRDRFKFCVNVKN